MEEISIGISGYITSLRVQTGLKIFSGTVLAAIRDDLKITGSD